MYIYAYKYCKQYYIFIYRKVNYTYIAHFTIFSTPNYRVFTGNCGKVTRYISGSITQKFLKFLYLDYHRWTYIRTYF